MVDVCMSRGFGVSVCGQPEIEQLSRDGSHYSLSTGILPSLGARSNRRVKLRSFILSPYDRRYRWANLIRHFLSFFLIVSWLLFLSYFLMLDRLTSEFCLVILLFWAFEKWRHWNLWFFVSSFKFFLLWIVLFVFHFCFLRMVLFFPFFLQGCFEFGFNLLLLLFLCFFLPFFFFFFFFLKKNYLPSIR